MVYLGNLQAGRYIVCCFMYRSSLYVWRSGYADLFPFIVLNQVLNLDKKCQFEFVSTGFTYPFVLCEGYAVIDILCESLV